MSQRILVATDFSQSADAAWRWAVDVGRSLDADLRLVHVAMPMAAEAPSNLHQDYHRDLSLAQRLLDERAAAAVPASRVKMILRRGEPVHVLAALARVEHIDLVVVGISITGPTTSSWVVSLSASYSLLRVRWSW